MLIGMDVPVPILGNVRCNRAGQILPVQTVVFVIEDVSSIPSKLFRQVAVERSRLHESKCLEVVFSNLPRDVVEDQLSRIAIARFPSPALEIGMRPLVWQDHCTDLFLGWIEDREIADRLPQGYAVKGFRPRERLAVTHPDNRKALTVLRHSVQPSVDDSSIGLVSGFLQPSEHVSEDSHVVGERHVRNVFHEHSLGAYPLNDVEKGSPQLPTVVLGVSGANLYEAADL
jgi:hypothetical protein